MRWMVALNPRVEQLGDVDYDVTSLYKISAPNQSRAVELAWVHWLIDMAALDDDGAFAFRVTDALPWVWRLDDRDRPVNSGKVGPLYVPLVEARM